MGSSFPPFQVSASNLSGATAFGKQLLVAVQASDVLNDLGLSDAPTSPISATSIASTGALTVTGTTTLIGGLAASSISVSGSTTLANLDVTGVVNLPHYTVANLPSASSVGAGAIAFAVDLASPTYGGVAVGGSTVGKPVYSDGTNWLS